VKLPLTITQGRVFAKDVATSGILALTRGLSAAQPVRVITGTSHGNERSQYVFSIRPEPRGQA